MRTILFLLPALLFTSFAIGDVGKMSGCTIYDWSMPVTMFWFCIGLTSIGFMIGVTQDN